MFNVRSANYSDLPYLYDICLKTADKGGDASHLLSDAYLVGQFFVAPYLFFELDTCFIAEKNGVPIGYIVGTTDSLAYNQWLNEKWLPDLRKKYPKNPSNGDLELFLFDTVHKDATSPSLIKDYPSHLHIDLLPIAQGQGLGAKLMTTFLDKLKLKMSPGVFLGVDDRNERALLFYKKYGYEVVVQEPGVVYLGMKL